MKMTVRNENGHRSTGAARRKKLTKIFAAVVLSGAALTMTTGCASSHGFRSGGESTNSALFAGVSDLETRVSALQPGMSREEVFEKLGVTRAQMQKLSRQQVTETLYAGAEPELSGGLEELEEARQFFNSLEGYRLNYRDVDEETGFSLTRVHKQSTGHDMSVTLIFRDGALYDTPEISGGPVNKKSSTTYLKVLTRAAPVKL